MPRGGRRPGAGAPKGNFNGVTNGASSVRLRMVYQAVLLYPDKPALIADLHRAGFLPNNLRRYFRAAVGFLYHYIFVDREEALATKAIKPRPDPNLSRPKIIDCTDYHPIKPIKDPNLSPPPPNQPQLQPPPCENENSNQTPPARFATTSDPATSDPATSDQRPTDHRPADPPTRRPTDALTH
ncbi:MAG: hypothetical protein HY873_05550 [Chloroflexi bacterium]|nr:hypothetical protein [Chloroflexota bacterium]